MRTNNNEEILKNNLRFPKMTFPIKVDAKKAMGIVLRAAQWTAAFVFGSVASPIILVKEKITREHVFNVVKITEKISKKNQNEGGEMRSEISGRRWIKVEVNLNKKNRQWSKSEIHTEWKTQSDYHIAERWPWVPAIN